jgi:D-sedoheptulose 7-phosphate isomerase
MNFNDYMTQNYNLPIEGDIEEALQVIRYIISKKRKIYIIGNGGSALSGSHFAQDLIKVCGAKAYNLSDNIGLITAIANDISYDDIYSFQLKLDAEKGDLLFAISCSGMSKNIIEAASVVYGKIGIISLTANKGGTLFSLSNLNINVPTNNIYIAESIHSIILHYLIDELKNNK